jgi:putative redox protein
MANVTVRLDEGLQARIQVRDFSFVADEPIADGGLNSGPMPTEYLLAALGACSAITVKLYAQRKGWPLEGVEVEVSRERFKKADYPAYTGQGDYVNEFRQKLHFKGELTDEQKTRLLEIAGKCPIHRALTDPAYMVEELIAAEEAQAE